MTYRSVIFTCVLASAVLPLHAGIITNGGFETGALSPWTKTGGDGNFTFVRAGVGESGAYGLLMGDGALANLSQTLTTTSGTNYILSYWLLDSAGGSLRDYFAVSFGGTLVADSVQTNADNYGWTQFQYNVTATDSSTVLLFNYYNGGAWYLDNVSVEPGSIGAAPEPSTMVLLGGVLVGIGIIRSRKTTHLVVKS